MFKPIENAVSMIKSGRAVSSLNTAPYASVSGGGVKVEMSAFDAGELTVSLVTIKAMLGLVSAQLMVVSPLSKDAPVALWAFIHAPGKDTVHLEALNTLLAPDSFDDLAAVKNAHLQPKDHASSLNWYEVLKLPGCVCRDMKPDTAESLSLCADWIRTYLAHAAKAPSCTEAVKTQHGRAVVQKEVLNDHDTVKQLYNLLGEERAKGLLMKAFYPKA